jgi:hypothetical protein
MANVRPTGPAPLTITSSEATTLSSPAGPRNSGLIATLQAPLWQAVRISSRELAVMIRYRKLGYVEPAVTDLERSAAFYRDMGLEPA